MSIGPRASVRINLALAILLTIVLSWVLSSGIANYLNYLRMSSLYRDMVSRPDIYPTPIPEPKFGIVEFLTGRPPGAGHWPPGPPPRPGPGRPPMGRPPGPEQIELRWVLLRLAVALGLAGLAGAWLGRKFTKPLMQLAEGADAFQSGDFEYRIPTSGKNEFAAVATAMNQMASQVSDHINRLEEDADRRRQLLADIAHELRSPVTTMRTMAGALQDGVADEPGRKELAVSSLVGTSERLLRLVQDLMELAKIDLNELPLNTRQVDLRELVNSAVQSHAVEAASHRVVLYPLDSDRPVNIVADPDRLIQVLNNILENAISYAGEGAEVRVRLEDSDPVRMIIEDTGKGISAQDLPRIFDSFYRADAARTPGEYHSGLGLSIARRLVEAHGGTLTVSSEEGKGTLVTIEIPKNYAALSNRCFLPMP